MSRRGNGPGRFWTALGRRVGPAALGVLLGLAGGIPARAGTVATCDEPSLRAQVEAGGTVTFGCSGIINLTNALSVAGDVVIDATDRDIHLRSAGAARLFEIATNGTLIVTNLILSGGRNNVEGGGAILNRGTVFLVSCILSNNAATGASGPAGRDSNDGGLNGGDGGEGGNGRRVAGGAVYNLGQFTAVETGFFDNHASGGNGGNGGDGHDGELLAGDGGSGGSGGAALGGAIFNGRRLELFSCGFDRNSVQGGDGGTGGENGEGAYPGTRGRGARGGVAGGGAVYSTNKAVAVLVGCTFSENNVTSGASSGGGSSRNSGKAGAHGQNAYGGGFCNYGVATVLNSTFFENVAQGGSGGAGQEARVKGGNGGDGGSAWGGGVFNAGTTAVTNCTFYGGVARPGTNGPSGEGAYRGRNGDPGHTRGANLGSAKGKLFLSHTILTNPPSTTTTVPLTTITWNTNIIQDVDSSRSNGTQIICIRITTTRDADGFVLKNTLTCETNDLDGSNLTNRTTITSTTNRVNQSFTDSRANAYGAIVDGGYNLVSDRSMKAKKKWGTEVGRVSRLSIDPRIETALANNGGPTETLRLLPGSPAEDAGSPTFILATDQRGATRPAGYGGDIGAFEVDGEIPGPPVITTQPVSVSARAGSNATFQVAAYGTQPLIYQWYHVTNGAVAGGTEKVLTLTNVQPSQVGGYYVIISNEEGYVTSATANLALTTGPLALSQPADVSADAGQNVGFVFPTAANPAAAYRWFFNGTNLIASATGSTLTLTNVQATNAGTYFAIATNLYGSVTSRVASLTITTGVPTATAQPLDQTGYVGENVTLSFGTVGAAAQGYRWYFNTNTLLTGVTGAIVTLTNVQLAQTGFYHAIATNSLGSVTSRLALVTVTNSAPIVSVPLPASTNVLAGGTLRLTAQVRGSHPFTYQWYFTDQGFNTSAVSGATNATLVVTNFQSNLAGLYAVAVGNAFTAPDDPVFSDPAQVDVAP